MMMDVASLDDREKEKRLRKGHLYALCYNERNSLRIDDLIFGLRDGISITLSHHKNGSQGFESVHLWKLSEPVGDDFLTIVVNFASMVKQLPT